MGGVPGTTKGQRDLDTRLVGGFFGKGIRLGPVDHVTSFLTTSAAQELCSIGQDSTTSGQERVGGVGWRGGGGGGGEKDQKEERKGSGVKRGREERARGVGGGKGGRWGEGG